MCVPKASTRHSRSKLSLFGQSDVRTSTLLFDSVQFGFVLNQLLAAGNFPFHFAKGWKAKGIRSVAADYISWWMRAERESLKEKVIRKS